MENVYIDLLKIGFGAVLTIGGQFIYNFIATKQKNEQESKKVKLQKLEEAFSTISDIVENFPKYTLKLIAPHSDIQTPKIEIGKLNLLISLYFPELKDDYKEITKIMIEISNHYIQKTLDDNTLKLQNELIIKSNLLRDKFAEMAQRI